MIESSKHATTLTGQDIPRYAILALRGALRLEIKGIRCYRGTTAFAVAKKKFGFKGNKEQVLEQLDAYIENYVAPALNSEIVAPTPQQVAGSRDWLLAGEPISNVAKSLCPQCHTWAIVELTPKQRLSQTDDTTHICHPGLGGCNTGFTDDRTRQREIVIEREAIPHGVCPKCGGAQLNGKGCTNDECPLVGSFA